MTLIETRPGETDVELRAVVDRILQTLNPSMPTWWHPYELRGTFIRDAKTYREFYCVAGSVELWLWKLAAEGNMRTVIVESL